MKNINFINTDPFIIAEISANHNGSFSLAKKLIKCAKDNTTSNTMKPNIETIIPSRRE